MAGPKNPGAVQAATGVRGFVHADGLNYPESNRNPDFAQLRSELLQQMRQVLEAALREKRELYQDPFPGLGSGWLQMLAALEGSVRALDRIEREGGL